jgi:hypothetical protein
MLSWKKLAFAVGGLKDQAGDFPHGLVFLFI